MLHKQSLVSISRMKGNISGSLSQAQASITGKSTHVTKNTVAGEPRVQPAYCQTLKKASKVAGKRRVTSVKRRRVRCNQCANCSKKCGSCANCK